MSVGGIYLPTLIASVVFGIILVVLKNYTKIKLQEQNGQISTKFLWNRTQTGHAGGRYSIL